MAEQASDSSQDGAGGSTGSCTIGWRSLLTPLWQSPPGGVPQSYHELVERGRCLQESQGKFLQKMAWWSEAQKSPEGSLVFIVAPRIPRRFTKGIATWDIIAYVLFSLHKHVVEQEKPFRVLWAMGSDHRLYSWDLILLRRSLHPQYLKSMSEFHVLHPSWAVRVLRLLLWPVAEDAYWDIFHCHERIEFMDKQIDTKRLRLPQIMYDYDKYLDEAAKEASDEAAKKMGMPNFKEEPQAAGKAARS
mmetsp:Transcript_2814/g.4656  ORF Transcript_2814/g.4656 Transcript_2814/m.4656 type:complete len:246 (+) Transcript_2814:31-768(+)